MRRRLNLSVTAATKRCRLERSEAGANLARPDLDTTRHPPTGGAPVKITLLSDDSLRLEPTPGPVTIEALSAEQSYSPFHMVAGGLAYCTFSVIYAWARNVKLNADDLTVDVAWTFADDPHRVARFDLHFNWPSLPPDRLSAAKRVAEMCTIHATLQHPPIMQIDGSAAPPIVSDREQADGAEVEH